MEIGESGKDVSQNLDLYEYPGEIAFFDQRRDRRMFMEKQFESRCCTIFSGILEGIAGVYPNAAEYVRRCDTMPAMTNGAAREPILLVWEAIF